MAVEVRVEDEGVAIDHRHRRVEVHHRVRLRQLDGDDAIGLTGLKKTLGEDFDAHRGRALTHADHHGAVAYHVHVTTFDRGGKVVLVVVAVVGHEVILGKKGVEAVDRPAVQRLTLAGGLGHWVDGDSAVDPAGIVPLEEVVRQRGEEEVVGAKRLPLEAAPGAHRVQVCL